MMSSTASNGMIPAYFGYCIENEEESEKVCRNAWNSFGYMVGDGGFSEPATGVVVVIW